MRLLDCLAPQKLSPSYMISMVSNHRSGSHCDVIGLLNTSLEKCDEERYIAKALSAEIKEWRRYSRKNKMKEGEESFPTGVIIFRNITSRILVGK
jgi:hypothetical protein